MKLKELLKRAQFHGAKILVDTKFSWYWSLSMAVLLSSAIMVLYVTIQRYFSGPTHIVKTESVRGRILFPTVIICPEVSYPDEKIDEFINEIEYPPSINSSYTKRVLKQLAAFSSPDVNFNREDLERIEILLGFNNLDVNTAALRLTPSCEEVLLRCRWRGTTVNCSSLFTMELTRVGYCCTFNGRSLRREMDGRNTKLQKINKDGHYVRKIGHINSLMVAVHQRHDLFDIDLVYKWLALRTGQHYIDDIVNGTPISPGVETWSSYITRNVQASEEVVDISSELRHCRLASEPLRYFPIYHKTYCLMECEMARTLDQCRCLKLTHPILPGIPICSAQRLICSRLATVSFAMDECNCPPTCNVEMEFSQTTTFEIYPEAPTYDSFYKGLDLERVSIVRVYVPTRMEKIFERKSYFTAINLFAQLGGVFNVFFGCSMLTLLELAILAWRAVRSCIHRQT